MSKKNDIFISYRRDGGDMLAMHLYMRLKGDGFNPFYDIESMRTGKFNEQLYEKIAECEDFICILPPNGLDRCANEGDWLRQEIAKAIELEKTIVPIMMRGFEFPSVLPDEIEELRYYNGIGASHEYFDASYQKLIGMLNSSSSSKTNDTSSASDAGAPQELDYELIANSIELAEACIEAWKYKGAMEHYEAAAQAGSAKAMCEIGRLYEEGLGVLMSRRKAASWYKRAAEANLRLPEECRSAEALSRIVALRDAAATFEEKLSLSLILAKHGGNQAESNVDDLTEIVTLLASNEPM